MPAFVVGFSSRRPDAKAEGTTSNNNSRPEIDPRNNLNPGATQRQSRVQESFGTSDDGAGGIKSRQHVSIQCPTGSDIPSTAEAPEGRRGLQEMPVPEGPLWRGTSRVCRVCEKRVRGGVYL